MSWSRPSYDVKAYEQTLKESQGPGAYNFAKPTIKDFRGGKFDESCKETQCFSFIPGGGGSGVSTRKDMDFTQVESNLWGIDLKKTNDQEKIKAARNPQNCDKYEVSEGLPGGGGVLNSVKGTDGKSTDGKRVGDDLNDYPECGIPAEDTRLSNPPCNLRGTGINRWEYLDRNPQEFFEVPRSGGIFAPTVNTRTILKDNHRPCIPNPVDQTEALPNPGPDPKCEKIANPCVVPTTALHPYYVKTREQCFCKE